MGELINKPGKIIILNGTSSSGKTSIAELLQEKLKDILFIFSSDDFFLKLPKKVLLKKRDQIYTDQHMSAYFSTTKAVAEKGINVIIDMVCAEPSWFNLCAEELSGCEVVLVGVFANIDDLKKREVDRGDREIGLAEGQIDRVHQLDLYDVRVNTSNLSTAQCVEEIVSYIESGAAPTAFAQLIVAD